MGVGELLFREEEWFFGSRHVWRQDRWIPVLKIKDRGDHGRRTKDILRGPKSLETKKKKKNLAAQRVEGTEVLEGQKKKMFNKQMADKKKKKKKKKIFKKKGREKKKKKKKKKS